MHQQEGVLVIPLLREQGRGVRMEENVYYHEGVNHTIVHVVGHRYKR